MIFIFLMKLYSGDHIYLIHLYGYKTNRSIVMNYIIKLSQFALLFIAFSYAIDSVTAQKIVPDNIAFSEATKGGDNGQVIRITTLDATGPGSLREAIRTKGPRIVVFEVGGIIDLKKSRLDCQNHRYLRPLTRQAPAVISD